MGSVMDLLGNDTCMSFVLIIIVLMVFREMAKGYFGKGMNINIAKSTKVKYKARDMLQRMFRLRYKHAKACRGHGWNRPTWLVLKGDKEIMKKRPIRIAGVIEDSKCFEFFLKPAMPLVTPMWFLCHPKYIENMRGRYVVVKARNIQPVSMWSIPVLNEKDGDNEEEEWKKYYWDYIRNLLKKEEAVLLAEQSLNNDIDAATGRIIPKELVIREPIGTPEEELKKEGVKV